MCWANSAATSRQCPSAFSSTHNSGWTLEEQNTRNCVIQCQGIAYVIRSFLRATYNLVCFIWENTTHNHCLINSLIVVCTWVLLFKVMSVCPDYPILVVSYQPSSICIQVIKIEWSLYTSSDQQKSLYMHAQSWDKWAACIVIECMIKMSSLFTTFHSISVIWVYIPTTILAVHCGALQLVGVPAQVCCVEMTLTYDPTAGTHNVSMQGIPICTVDSIETMLTEINVLWSGCTAWHWYAYAGSIAQLGIGIRWYIDHQWPKNKNQK